MASVKMTLPVHPAERRRVGLGTTESPVQAACRLVNPLCLPSRAGLIPAMPGSAMQDFRIFHTILGARIAQAAMAGNTIVVVWRYPSRGSRPSLITRRRQKQEKNDVRPSKKTVSLTLTQLINDGVFRPNRRYDSEAQGRQVSIDKNQESARGEARKSSHNLLVFDLCCAAALSKRLARPVCQTPSGLAARSFAATVLRLRSATVTLRRGLLPRLARALRQRFAFPGSSGSMAIIALVWLLNQYFSRIDARQNNGILAFNIMLTY
jgi:hypothetical protein